MWIMKSENISSWNVKHYTTHSLAVPSSWFSVSQPSLTSAFNNLTVFYEFLLHVCNYLFDHFTTWSPPSFIKSPLGPQWPPPNHLFISSPIFQKLFYWNPRRFSGELENSIIMEIDWGVLHNRAPPSHPSRCFDPSKPAILRLNKIRINHCLLYALLKVEWRAL